VIPAGSGPRGQRPRALASLVVTACLFLGGCVTPATGSDSYRDKAVTSVRAATSEVATAQLTVRLLRRHRIMQPYADETITANETALGSISTAFGSVQPPPEDDPVRTEVAGVLSAAEDAVAAARIAARRSDRPGLAQVAGDLREVSDDLADAEKSLS
jgi:hypothetical protein